MKPRGMLVAVFAFVAVAVGVGVVVAVVDRGGEDRVLLEATLDCASHIDVVSDLPDGFRVVQGVAAINSTIVHGQRRRGTDPSPDSPLRSSKIPLLVRPNQVFQVSVGDDSPESARIDWSSATSRLLVQRVSVGPCAGDPDSWLVFAGGVWVAEPSCVELVFRTSNGSTPVMLSIAEPCPDAE